MGILYSIKSKKHMHIDSERIKKSLKEFMKGTLKIQGTFQGTLVLATFFSSFSWYGNDAFSVCNYIYLVYKLKFFFWTCSKFWIIFMTDLYQIFMIEIISGTVFFVTFWRLWKLVFWRKIFQNLIFMFSFYPWNNRTGSIKTFMKNNHLGVVGRGKLTDSSLSSIFNLLLIGLQ